MVFFIKAIKVSALSVWCAVRAYSISATHMSPWINYSINIRQFDKHYHCSF
jgi:hypothetical protein